MGDANPVGIISNALDFTPVTGFGAYNPIKDPSKVRAPFSSMGSSASNLAAGGVKKPGLPGLPAPLEDPTAAARAAAEGADKEQAKKRAKAIVSTVLSSPLGVSSGQPVQRSVLSSLGG